MKKYTPYIGVGLVISMIYFLVQLQQNTASFSDFANLLGHQRVMLLLSICSLSAILLGFVGTRQLNRQLSYFAWVACVGGALILVFTLLIPLVV